MPPVTAADSEEPEEPESMRSDDPDFEQLWDMPYGEFLKVAEDPANPLHAKARIISAEIMEPFATAIQASTAPARSALTENLGEWARTALKPLYDVGANVSAAYSPEFAKMAQGMVKALRSNAAASQPLGPVDISTSPSVVVDFAADQAPEGVTVGQVHDAAQAKVVETLAAMFTTAQEQLAHLRARADADDERDKRQQGRDRILDARHLDTARLSRWGVVGGWVAAGLAAVALVAQVIASITPEQ